MRVLLVVPLMIGVAALAAEPPAGQVMDAAYGEQVRAHTTRPEFLTDLVDHLPASDTVPTPLAFFGRIAGAEGALTYAADIHRYMRALDAASPRVTVFSIGMTEEGREMIAVAVADEATIAALDEYRAITAALSDPRRTTPEQAAALIERGKPIYYLTGGLHSPETGAPEMLMELAYRLAVEDSERVRTIRENVITLITPVLEVDGRERMVDLARLHAADPKAPLPPLVYWGHYVAHDNNRDAIGLALALTRNLLGACREWHPQVLHDLHESIPFLYVSTGTGPYNAWLDPLTIQEWERMAANEVQTLTAKGLPGVWTHGFYDGWAPGYLFWLGVARGSIGRFYETFGNHLPTTEDRVVRGRWAERAWFRPNPPLPTVRWSLRNNVNYQQSGVLVALSEAAASRRRLLEQFYRLGARAVAKARAEGPAAYLLPADQPRLGNLRDLLELLDRHGVEVHVAERAFSLDPLWPPAAPDPKPNGEKTTKAAAERGFPVGSLIIRMDQPASRLADALFDTQFVRGEDRVYDDTGWTLGMARNVDVVRIVNPAVLDQPMHRWQGAPLRAPIERKALEAAAALAVGDHADTDLARLRFSHPELRMVATESAVKARDGQRAAGTVLVDLAGADRARLAETLAKLDLDVWALPAMPAVEGQALGVPRVALVHTWQGTQDEGWWRLALEDLGIHYDYVSTRDLATMPDLAARYDVVLFPPADGSSPQEIVNGLPPGPPLPWRPSELTPNLGGPDETEDMRGGLGLDGVRNLEAFVEAGGTLIAAADTARWAVTYGLARWVEVVEPTEAKARGVMVTGVRGPGADRVAAGYDQVVPVYLPGDLLFRVGAFREPRADERRPSGRGGADDPDVPQGRPYVAPPPRPTPAPGEKGFQLPENLTFFYAPYQVAPEDRPRVVLEFPEKASEISFSGMLDDPGALAGKAIVVECPRGRGRVVLFASNPMWRQTTQGSWPLVVNAMLRRPASTDDR